jgi:hypothetical protein
MAKIGWFFQSIPHASLQSRPLCRYHPERIDQLLAIKWPTGWMAQIAKPITLLILALVGFPLERLGSLKSAPDAD